MADDITSELRIVAESAAVSVADWSDLMREAADEIERLRRIMTVEAPYALTWHVEKPNRYRSGLELQQDRDGWWSIVLFVDGAYRERSKAEAIMRDVWAESLADACRILEACYQQNWNAGRG